MKKIIKASKLNIGDKIALISPSSPLASKVLHRTERAKNFLEKMGFIVVLGKNALHPGDYSAGTAEERASDVMEAFSDSSIKGIISFIGGFHSNQILKYLDFNIVRKNPKVFCGYSDISVLHFAFLTQAKLSTFYGPAALTQWAENPQPLPYTVDYFRKAVMSHEPIGEITPSPAWTDEVLNWFEKKDMERSRLLQNNNGYIWLKEGVAAGNLVGGCITSILHLRGTKYWPDFTDTIFFFDTPESSGSIMKGEPLSRVDAHLADLELSGVFEKISGMIVGRPYGYTLEESKLFQQLLIQRLQKYSFPILFNADIGHTDPMITIPLGVEARMSSEKNSFQIVEAGVL